MKKLLLTTALIACCLTSLLAQPCLPQGITFTTQAQIDSFQINYPGCTEILGGVTIDGNDISNLNGLSEITHIGGNLWLNYFGGGNNTSLNNLIGLEGLTSIGDNLLIEYNQNLTSLAGLDNLTSIGSNLEISGNNSLTNITALGNLTSIGWCLKIQENSILSSLEGLQNINPSTIACLTIIFNDFLSKCEVNSICEYLALPTSEIEIDENALGCISVEEVEEACLTDVQEVSYNDSFTISPNPISSTTIVEYALHQSSRVTLQIFDIRGQVVTTMINEQQQGEQRVTFNTEGLKPGVYFCMLKTSEGIQTRKIIKL